MHGSVCPHCHTSVPTGATVCTGCQAEVEYGAPSAALVLVILVAGFIAYSAGHATHVAIGWAVFVVIAGGGLYGCSQLFKNRVSFKRIYRTRR
ncbi:MAG TPA: hypothetical protein VGC55_16170 [Dokdonella sp.]